ncbi:hypothetical protein D9M72_435120 [compost metagenome]
MRCPLHDHLPSLGGVAGGQQVVERHVSVAVVGLPVGERQFLGFQDGVHAQFGGRIKVLVRETVKDRKGLQERRTLAPRTRLGDGVSPELNGGCGFVARFESPDVIHCQHSAVVSPGRMAVRRLHGLHHGLRYKAPAPFPACGVDTRFPRGPRGSRLHQPFKGARVRRIPDQFPLRGDSAPGHPQLGRSGPVLCEQLRN